MKRLLFAVASLAFGFGASAQTIVSTEVQKRNVVIEEYTGINCTWCPLGHQTVSEYAEQNPGRVVAINIHTGGFAANTYTTSYGDKIAAQTNLQGYPAASVNRIVKNCKINAGTPYNNQGGSAVKPIGDPILAEDSPVNVAATASIDVAERKMYVKVEVYYTADAQQKENLLHIALLQDSVIGTQTNGGGYNQSQVLPNGKYRHMHMFRDFLTGQWGETLTDESDSEVIPAGTLITKEYVYDIPAVISKEVVKLNHLTLAIFITDSEAEGCSSLHAPNIWTGISVNNIELTNATGLAASLNDVLLTPQLGKCNNLVDVTASVSNDNGTEITSIEFEYGNATAGSEYKTYTWTGSLGMFSSAELTMPESIEVELGTNSTIEVKMLSINGQAVENATVKSKVKKNAVKQGQGPITLYLKTDQYADEVSWFVYDADGNILHKGGGYENGASRYDTVVLTGLTSEGCYSFEIRDTYGDGCTDQQTTGSYRIKDSQGTSLVYNSNGNWGFGEQKDFKSDGKVGLNDADANIYQSVIYPNPAKDNATLSVNLVNSDNAVISVIDVMGREVISLGTQSLKSGENHFNINTTNLNNGIYYVRVVTNNGITTNKLSVAK